MNVNDYDGYDPNRDHDDGDRDDHHGCGPIRDHDDGDRDDHRGCGPIRDHACDDGDHRRNLHGHDSKQHSSFQSLPSSRKNLQDA